uniref:Uncharacterized protein n=1 Tax=Arion vulgaris TaxID=1028688 RepID=A0A0B6YRC2_9EUPU
MDTRGVSFVLLRLWDENTDIDIEFIQHFKKFESSHCTSRTGCLRSRMRSVNSEPWEPSTSTLFNIWGRLIT